MSAISSFISIENKHGVYRGKDCMKKFCKFLRKHEKKKMKLLTKEWQESYEDAKIYYICNKKFKNKNLKDKQYHKVRDYSHYKENIEVLRIVYVI